jgi:hypothetical protein
MDKFDRATRRHHVQRLKKARRYYWGFGRSSYRHNGSAIDRAPSPPKGMDDRLLGKILNTPQLCSCLGCGNQRHNTAGWTPTLQEQRWAVQYREQLEEAEKDLDAKS